MITWTDFIHVHDSLVGSTSLILNLTLLFSLSCHYEPEWQQLRLFLGLNAAVDAIYSFIELVTHVVAVATNGTFALFSIGPIQLLGRDVTIAFLYAYLILIYTSFAIVPSTFLYRYILLNPDKFPSLRKCVVAIFVGMLLVSVPCDYCAHGLIRDEEGERDVRSMMTPEMAREFVNFTVLGRPANSRQLLILITVVSTEFLVVYTVAVVSIIKLRRFLNQNAEFMTRRTAVMNHRLMKALTLQAFGPFVTCFIPVGVYVVVLLGNMKAMDSVCFLLSTFLSWIPLMNAIIAFSFFNPYRRYVISCLKHAVTGGPTTVHPITSSAT